MKTVLKANGEQEPFSEEKFLTSIRRAGITKDMQAEVLTHVKEKFHNHMPTSEIYHHIVEFLDNSPEAHSNARYNLKQAIMDLGPTGYPFEDYVARILGLQGYTTTTRNIIKGSCISHEIDVIAEKKFPRQQKIMVEAKYHNRLGVKTEVHVAMYTKARFDDIRDENNFTDVLLITNTKATTDAISYALCNGMKIISWSYPNGSSLRDLVEMFGLHPITALNSISGMEKQALLRQGIVLCRDICNNHTIIDVLNESPDKKKKILDEALFVCSIEKK